MKIAILLGRPLLSALLFGATLGLAAEGCSEGGGGKGSGLSCVEANCDAGLRCVQDACRPECKTQSDCPVGQNCAGWGFEDGTQGNFCVVLDYAKDGRTGQFEACKKDDECDALRGFTCLDGECSVRCDSHFDCASVGLCEPSGTVNTCKVGTAAKVGQYYQHCPGGDPDCDTAAGFTCQSAGLADLDSYCSTDCTDDSECPSGFRCGTTSATPCMDACGVVGSNGPKCVAAAKIGPGKAYECVQPFGLIHHICERRQFCSPCETDADCLGVPGQICARDQSGEKICTQACDPSVDSCPWGNASECGEWDSSLGFATCAHRFGSCRGTGKGCEPCVDTTDCAPTGFCSRASFTGEQFCIDLSVECVCGADAVNDTCTGHGCPDTPGGIAMTCYAGTRYAGDPITNRCIGASSLSSALASPQSGCWKR